MVDATRVEAAEVTDEDVKVEAAEVTDEHVKEEAKDEEERGD